MNLNRIIRTTGFRLAALYAGLFGLSVIALFAIIYWIASEALHQQLVAGVEREAAALKEDHRIGGSQRLALVIEQRIASRLNPAAYYLLVDSDGRTIAGNLPDVSPHEGWQDVSTPLKPNGDDDADLQDHRVIALGIVLADRSLLVVGEDIFQVVEVEEAIVRAFGWALGITAVLAAVGGVVLSFGFLRRIDAINRTSRAIIEGNLTDRIQTRGTDDELDRLAINLNQMLDRVQALMDSLRQVSSDIAHDLKTPLSHLHQRLEAARSKAHRIEDYEIAVDQAIIAVDSILLTFAALLRIAQIEAGTRKAAFSTVDLSGVFQSIVETYGAVAEDRGQTLLAAIEPGIYIRGDRELLTQMLANLITNAMRHTPTGSHIGVTLTNQPSGPIGMVTDNGKGIPTDMREKVFQRFVRLEQSRSTPGSGLGLSLVAAVADIHGIVVTLLDNEPGLKVVLDFTHTTLGSSASAARRVEERIARLLTIPAKLVRV